MKKLILLSGGNTGIGKATVKDMSARGARVVILCRSLDKGNDAAMDIEKVTGNKVESKQLDLSSLKSVRQCASNLANQLDKVDILINNAGIICPELKTEDGFDMQFATNHLGHFLLTELLLPLLKKSASGGVVPR